MTIRERYNLAIKMKVIVNKIREIVNNVKYSVSRYIEQLRRKHNMFSLAIATEQHKEFLHAKEYGLPVIHKPQEKRIDKIDETNANAIDEQAEREGMFYARRYKDINIRLHKSHGEFHH